MRRTLKQAEADIKRIAVERERVGVELKNCRDILVSVQQERNQLGTEVARLGGDLATVKKERADHFTTGRLTEAEEEGKP
jgi:uncharacterized protein (DUF3084 family)